MQRRSAPDEGAETFNPDLLPPAGEGLVAVIRGGAALAKAENDSLIQVSITRPRDPARALARALAELALDSEFAASQYYIIPFKNSDGSSSNVEGLSIKAAMALGRAFGNCSVSARVIDETPEAFVVEGVAIDLESLFRVSKVGSVSKYYRDRKTKRMVKWRDDRFPQLLAAASSKQVRNAILNIIPEPMQRRYFSRAKEVAALHEREKAGGKGKAGGKKAAADSVVNAFAAWGVTREALEAKIGVGLDEATDEHFGTLRGFWNAINDGMTTPEDCFGPGPVEDDGAQEAEEAAPESPLKGGKR